MNFKIIAARPLKGCDTNILKNLTTDQFYFFDNNYNVDLDGDFIKKRNGNSLAQNFFYNSDLSIDSTLKYVNIQGLVGKNGEGKSSLIELLIRILNNFFKTYGIGEITEKLVFVKNLHADLYYLKDDSIYRIYINSINENSSEEAFNIVARFYHETTLIYDSEKTSKNIDENNIIDLHSLFFTMYINYSIYGLDEIDYIKESFISQSFLKKNDDFDKNDHSWLSQIFHKNDGYQTPLVLHPFRDNGQINIRNEKYLMDQRFLSLILDSENVYEKITDDLLIDKLSLTLKVDALESYIEEFFFKYGKADDLEGYGDFLSHHLEEIGSTWQVEKMINNYFEFLAANEKLLNKFRSVVIVNPVRKMTDLRKINLILSARALGIYNEIDSEEIYNKIYSEILGTFRQDIRLSDINLTEPSIKDKIEYILLQTKDFNFQYYNLFQNLTIYYDFWKEYFAYEPLGELSNGDILKNRLFDYCLIKSFKIIKYPKYKDRNRHDSIDDFLKNYTVRKEIVDEHLRFLRELNSDDSHITLKLRQCIILLKMYLKNECEDSKGLLSFYEQFVNSDNKNFEFKDLSHLIDETFKYDKVEKLLLLPPRIFDVEIFLKTNDEKKNDISIRTLSSGEYQKVCIISSIIYHLKNLDSVIPIDENLELDKPAIYNFENISVILDEIELYFHPEFQRQFIRELLTNLNNTRFRRIKSINFLFITHSPFILSDIPKNNVLFLEKGNPVFPMTENTFASNIHTLLQHGFFLNSAPIGEFAKNKINYLFKILHEGNIADHNGNDIYEEILIVSEPFIKGQLLKLYNDLNSKSKNLELEKIVKDLRDEVNALKEKLND